MICISRKSNTANPFVIYDFYDKLATIFDANPDLNPKNIWNCDESGFLTEPGKSKVIAPCNKPGFKLSSQIGLMVLLTKIKVTQCYYCLMVI